MPSKILPILVHGTFDRESVWTKPDSCFSLKLKEELGMQGDTISFQWSGANSYQGRVRAGHDLAIFLVETKRKYPKYRFVLIGHSHGGNVIFYALKELPEDWEHIKVVTLSTPFLISSQKVNSWTAKMLVAMNKDALPYILMFLVMWLIGVPVFVLSFMYVPKLKIPYLDLVAAAVGFLSVLFLCYKTYHLTTENPFFTQYQDEKQVAEKVNEVFERIDIRVNRKVDLLAIAVVKDEADWWLELSNRVSHPVRQFFNKINAIAWRIARVLMSILFFVILSLFPTAFLPNQWRSTYGNFIVIFIEIIMGYWATYAVLFLLIRIIFSLLSANPVFYGRNSWIQYLFIKTSPSAYPVHVPEASFIKYVIKGKPWNKWRHSLLQEDPNLIGQIAKWVMGQTAAASTQVIHKSDRVCK